MDWLQFIANVLGSLAWPFVVAYFLFLIRSNLSSLLSRLEDLTLPGGAKATFSKTVEKAKDDAIALAATFEDTQVPAATDPKASRKENMRLLFEQTERDMIQKLSALPLAERQSPSDFIFHILRPFRKSDALYNLYNKLRDILSNAYNVPDSEITDSDLSEYGYLCNIVLQKFISDYNHWSIYNKKTHKT